MFWHLVRNLITIIVNSFDNNQVPLLNKIIMTNINDEKYMFSLMIGNKLTRLNFVDLFLFIEGQAKYFHL